MTQRPIFVVGFPRSGTTLLQAMLGRHPLIAAPPEVHFFFRIYGLRDYWGDLADDARARRVVHELVHAPMGLLDECGFNEGRIADRFLAGDRSYRSLLRCLLDDFAERAGKPGWSEKTPHQQPHEIWSVFPEARVAHIIRDPRETVASAVATGVVPLPPRLVARRWCDFVVAARTAESDDRYLELRYEDLAADPMRELIRVCAFLGVEPDPSMLSPAGGSSAVPVERAPWQAAAVGPVHPARRQWRRRLGRVDRAVVAALVEDLVADLGYPASPRSETRLGRLLLAVQRERAHTPPIASGGDDPAARYAAVQQLIARREAALGVRRPGSG